MFRRGRPFLVALAAMLAALAVSSGVAMGQGGDPQTATIGHNLEQPPNDEWGHCDASDDPCTNQITGLPDAAQAAGGITAPFDGTIVTWRISCGIPENGDIPQECDEQ